MEDKSKSIVLKRILAWVIAIVVALSIITVPQTTAEAATGTVKSISVSNVKNKKVTIYKGNTLTLKTTVKVTGKASKAVTYKTSNKKVATVTAKGKISAKKVGKATITITSKANKKKTLKIKVTVKKKPTVKSVKVTNVKNKKLTLKVGATKSLKTKVTVSGSASKAVKYKSSNKKVATVSSKGKITAKGKGTATITVTSKANKKKKVKIKVTVKVPVTSVAVSGSTTVLVGKTTTLKATVSPSNANNTKVTWTSSNAKVATVSSKGVVTGKSGGKVTITAKSKDNSKIVGKYNITVNVPVSSVALKGTSTIAAGATTTLTATVLPTNASNKTLTWTSSNAKVATVSSTGVVKGIAGGTATITAKANDGSNKSATFKVTVVNPVKIASVNVINSLSVQVVLQNTASLSAANFKVYNKENDAGTYNRNCVIDTVTTTDNKTYTLTLNTSSYLAENNMVKVEVKGTYNTDSKETRYSAGVFTYNREKIFTATKGVSFDEAISAGSESVGYSIYTVTSLPSGLKYKVSDSGDSVRIYGTPTGTGSVNSTVSCKDEMGNVFNYTVKFCIGNTDAIAATSNVLYGVAAADGTYSIDTYPITSTGGSGSYVYSIEGTSYELTMSEKGNLYGTLRSTGTYNIKVKVVDANNTKLVAYTTVTINVVQGYSVAGMTKDLKGNAIPSATLTFTNKDKSIVYTFTGSTTSNYTGTYSVILPAGTYDIKAEYGDTVAYLFNQTINTSQTGYDITIPIYKVSIYSNNSSISASSFGSWLNSDEETVGSGDTLYLRAGTYSLHTNVISSNDLYTYKATLNITVGANTSIATASVSVVSSNVKGTIAQNGHVSVTLTYDTTNGTRNFALYKFTPTVSGTYYFYTDSSIDTYGKLYDSTGSQLTSNDDSGTGNNFGISYYCNAGTTYYIGAAPYNSSGNGVVTNLYATSTVPSWASSSYDDDDY